MFLAVPGETLDISCAGDTLTAKAFLALPIIIVRKLVTVRSCSLLPVFWCGARITYWAYVALPTGQEFSGGSPLFAAPENTEPIQVTFTRDEEDGTETVLGSLVLDPGEIVDPSVGPGPVDGSGLLSIAILAGDVEVTFDGQTRTVGPGQTSEIPVGKATQSLTFEPISDRMLDGAPFAVNATASSGLPVTLSVAPGSVCLLTDNVVTLTGAGACTLVASQAGNNYYLPAPPVSRTFSVFYSWSGVLPPLSPDSATVVKRGSTVPVKFSLTGAGATVTDLAARIFAVKLSDAVAMGEEIELTAQQADAGNIFRYDAAERQYIFNWGTRDAAEGTWRIRVDLLDGNLNRTATVVVKK
jgi:hypothetical protein